MGMGSMTFGKSRAWLPIRKPLSIYSTATDKKYFILWVMVKPGMVLLMVSKYPMACTIISSIPNTMAYMCSPATLQLSGS